MTLSYHSNFAADIIEMQRWRGVMGYKDSSYQYLLKDFDTFCEMHFPNENVLTWDIAISFLTKIRERRDVRCDVVALRNLAKYQIASGKKACVFPADFFSYKRRKLPYIMSLEECRNFFNAADKLSFHTGHPLLGYTASTIFRLQYATGMRPQEVRNLSLLDFDFVHDTIYITNAKGHKERRIAVHHSVMNLCKKYNQVARSFYPESTCFFPSCNQTPHCDESIRTLFHKCWDASGNRKDINYCSPYIFRHNFATHLLMKWSEEGKNLDTYIPYLSTYMGHSTLADTYYYVHLLPDRLSKMEYMRVNDIIPEVYDER